MLELVVNTQCGANMGFELIDKDWEQHLRRAMAANDPEVWLVSPFIKHSSVEKLLKQTKHDTIRVITRFDLENFYSGVSDISALRFLLDHGATIRGVKRLHSKLFVFHNREVICGSANLTGGGLHGNFEFGFRSDTTEIVGSCSTYARSLWDRAGDDLTGSRLDGFGDRIHEAHQARSRELGRPKLPDLGTEIGLPDPNDAMGNDPREPVATYLKFLGTSNDRWTRSRTVFDCVKDSGCNWAVSFPKGSRPRQIEDGEQIFIARLVSNPNDSMVFGVGVGMKHREVLDDATEEEIKAAPWRAIWPHYVRISECRFLSGPIGDGVSVRQMEAELGPSAYASTEWRDAHGQDDINPALAVRRQPGVKLTLRARDWLLAKLDESAARQGWMSENDESFLDWPSGFFPNRRRTISPFSSPQVRTLFMHLAKVAEDGRTLNYLEAGKVLGYGPRDPKLNKMLLEISTRTEEAFGVMVSVLVVGVKQDLPGSEFYSLAERFVLKTKSETPMAFSERETKRVHQYFSTRHASIDAMKKL